MRVPGIRGTAPSWLTLWRSQTPAISYLSSEYAEFMPKIAPIRFRFQLEGDSGLACAGWRVRVHKEDTYLTAKGIGGYPLCHLLSCAPEMSELFRFRISRHPAIQTAAPQTG